MLQIVRARMVCVPAVHYQRDDFWQDPELPPGVDHFRQWFLQLDHPGPPVPQHVHDGPLPLRRLHHVPTDYPGANPQPRAPVVSMSLCPTLASLLLRKYLTKIYCGCLTCASPPPPLLCVALLPHRRMAAGSAGGCAGPLRASGALGTERTPRLPPPLLPVFWPPVGPWVLLASGELAS
jgi:hypothetical protein